MSEITGYKRKNGRFGIRNHVLVLATVSCVNGVVNRISREVPEAVCVTHAHGCGRVVPGICKFYQEYSPGLYTTSMLVQWSLWALAVSFQTRKTCSLSSRKEANP
jgi:hypothetical protein